MHCTSPNVTYKRFKNLSSDRVELYLELDTDQEPFQTFQRPASCPFSSTNALRLQKHQIKLGWFYKGYTTLLQPCTKVIHSIITSLFWIYLQLSTVNIQASSDIRVSSLICTPPGKQVLPSQLDNSPSTACIHRDTVLQGTPEHRTLIHFPILFWYLYILPSVSSYGISERIFACLSDMINSRLSSDSFIARMSFIFPPEVTQSMQLFQSSPSLTTLRQLPVSITLCSIT